MMGLIDWILLGLIAAAVGFAVYLCIRRKKKGSSCCGGGCDGNCAGCAGKCHCKK